MRVKNIENLIKNFFITLKLKINECIAASEETDDRNGQQKIGAPS